MRLEITRQQNNKLLKRDEVEFRIDQEGNGTPSRIEVRQKLSAILGVELERIYITQFITKSGTTVSLGQANIYDSMDQALTLEPKHILLRNKTSTEKKE